MNLRYRLKDFLVYGVTSDFPLASIGFLPIITLQCILTFSYMYKTFSFILVLRFNCGHCPGQIPKCHINIFCSFFILRKAKIDFGEL